MKKIFSLFAAVLFAGSIMAADATIATGTENSYDDVSMNGKPAIKLGTSKKTGDMKITVGTGATSLVFHAVAWKGEGDKTMTITAPEGVTVTPATVTLKAHDDINGNFEGGGDKGKAFLLDNESDYEFTVELSGVSAETELKVTYEKRCVIWGAVYHSFPTALDNAKAAVKAVKTIENGQVVIEKGGVRYNAFGQIVK